MDERVMQFRLGVMVLATLIIAAILVVMLGEFPTPFRGTYTIEVIFPKAPGMKEGTPVRKSGIRIGRVTKVGFAADDPRLADKRGVLVTAEIDGNRKLYEDEVCRIKSTLLGDVELTFAVEEDEKKAPSGELLDTSRVLEGKFSADPTGLKDVFEDEFTTIKEAGIELKNASIALGKAGQSVSDLLETNQEGITRAIDEAHHTLTAVREVATTAQELIGDKETQRKLREAMKKLPDTIDQMNDAMTVARRNLEHLEKFTRPLGENGAERVRQIDQAISMLGSLMTQIEGFGRRLNSRQGSLGKLLHDPELYTHLNSAARNVDRLTRKLEPIINDVRVFTDKIARDPGSLGVRGALKRNIPIK